jgi:phospholipase C
MSDHCSHAATRRLAHTVALALAAGAATGYAGLAGASPQTTTPVGHVVVIFQENVSFDHYFATYPLALNLSGEPRFHAREDTPSVNGLGTLADGMPEGALLTNNPNANNSANGVSAINPFRLDRSQASTCDQDHNYGAEQLAFDGGLMDLFPASVGQGASSFCAAQFAYGKGQGIVMGYFDGNTVTALWNYAQHYAMNDHSFSTVFGPSTPGALNLVSGQTNGVTNAVNPGTAVVADGSGGVTDIGDADPTGDICSSTSKSIGMSGKNIGDLLNAANITWGFFQGGFDLSITNSNGTTGCTRSTGPVNIPGHPATADYIPHHQPFQYYASTANPNHTRPTSIAAIGTTDAAKHQYDIHDFTDALAAGNMPAVSFLKAPAYQDAHAGYSDPLDEQTFVVNTINAIEKSSFWPSTAIIIAYDDSDGWYDHVMGKIMNGSESKSDALTAAGKCGDGATALPGVNPATTHVEGRCGFGPRLPLIVVSPWAKANFVDHSVTDQTSILRFVEDNWSLGRLGDQSYDELAGPLDAMFDFEHPTAHAITLDAKTGEVTR